MDGRTDVQMDGRMDGRMPYGAWSSLGPLHCPKSIDFLPERLATVLIIVLYNRCNRIFNINAISRGETLGTS